MGRRGPAPTPTTILEARGSWRAKKRRGEPAPPEAPEAPEPPDWLRDDARELWTQVVTSLSAMGIVGETDTNALGRYCMLLARWIECEKFIANHGHAMPVRDEDGNAVGVKEFPQVGRASRLADQLLRLEQQFGMTAAARVALRAVDVKGQIEQPVEPGTAREAALRLIR